MLVMSIHEPAMMAMFPHPKMTVAKGSQQALGGWDAFDSAQDASEGCT